MGHSLKHICINPTKHPPLQNKYVMGMKVDWGNIGPDLLQLSSIGVVTI